MCVWGGGGGGSDDSGATLHLICATGRKIVPTPAMGKVTELPCNFEGIMANSSVSNPHTDKRLTVIST